MVKAFNRVYEERVRATPGLVWLDLLPQLLSPDGNQLAAGLELDGTHLSPRYAGGLRGEIEDADAGGRAVRYVPLLGEAINQALAGMP
jgi:hypothetical protein